MKAVKDFKINVTNVPYYETGVEFQEYDVVYFSGIYEGTYSENGFTETVGSEFTTGYYYATKFLPSGDNYFYNRPGGENDLGVGLWQTGWFYTPSYGSTVNFEADYTTLTYGDNYENSKIKNSNFLKVSADLKFNGISDLEAKSITHFYENQAYKNSPVSGLGVLPVNMDLFPPFSIKNDFYFKDLQYEYKYSDVNNLTLKVESPFISYLGWKEKLIPLTADNILRDNDKRSFSKHDYLLIKDVSEDKSKGFWYYSGNGSTDLDFEFPTQNLSWTKDFYFVPDMSNGLTVETDLTKNDYGKFYNYERTSNLPKGKILNLNFSNRSDKEAKALLHFLESKGGVNSFIFGGLPNFEETGVYYCPSWSHTPVYADNNSITAKLVERTSSDDLLEEIDYYYSGHLSGDNFSFFLDNDENRRTGISFGYVPSGFAVAKDITFLNSGFGLESVQVSPIKNRYDGYDYSEKMVDTFFYENDFSEPAFLEKDQAGRMTAVFYISSSSGPETAPFVDGGATFDSTFVVEQRSFETTAQSFVTTVGITGFSDAASSSNFPSGPNADWLSHCNTFAVFPDLEGDNNSLNVKAKWKPPSTGYFFNRFVMEIATDASFSNIIQTKNKQVERIDKNDYVLSNLYGSSFSGLASAYELDVEGLELSTNYYFRVWGANDPYSASGGYVYASGVTFYEDAFKYPNVVSGLTDTIPAVRFDPFPCNLNFNNSQIFDFDLFSYITENCGFRDNFNFYSSVNLFFNDTDICSRKNYPNSIGSFIITGNYTGITGGVNIEFNNTKVVGRGGSVPRFNDLPVWEGATATTVVENEQAFEIQRGKTALYCHYHGDIKFTIDENSYFAGGGGAGTSLTEGDLRSYLISWTDYVQEHTDVKYSEEDIKNFDLAGSKTAFENLKGSKLTRYIASLRSPSNVFTDVFPTTGNALWGGAGAGCYAGSGALSQGEVFSDNGTSLDGSHGQQLMFIYGYQNNLHNVLKEEGSE